MSKFSRLTQNQINDEMINRIIELDNAQVNWKLWPRDTWDEVFTKKNYSSWVIEKDQNLIGFAIFYLTADGCAHLLKILIQKDFRGINLGKELMVETINNFKQEELKQIYLEVAVNNIPAKKLYSGLGFYSLTIKKKFYSDGTDACAMQLIL